MITLNYFLGWIVKDECDESLAQRVELPGMLGVTAVVSGFTRYAYPTSVPPDCLLLACELALLTLPVLRTRRFPHYLPGVCLLVLCA